MTDASTPGPYEDLTPAAVLEALESSGLYGDGRLLQLNSYENRVFQVFLEDGSVVVAKFYRPHRWSNAQILEEHAFALQLAAAEVPVVAPLALSQGGRAGPTLGLWADGRNAHRWSVSPRRAGREPELESEGTLAILGRFLARLHVVGAEAPFEHRRHMQPGPEARAAAAWVVEHGFIPPSVEASWLSLCEQAARAIERRFALLPSLKCLRLHGDCHLGNVLWRDGLPHIVDLDDACTGPAVQDLWMLVAGDEASAQAQMQALLAGYEQIRDFDHRELALIEPLRTLRMLRHSAWIAERWSDPAFPHAFPFFGDEAYWRQQITQLRDQLELMAAD